MPRPHWRPIWRRSMHRPRSCAPWPSRATRTGVIVATPSTLIALLKAVAYGWRQDAVVENAALIRDLGQELHRRLASFLGHFSKAGRQLSGAVDAYNSAVGS